MPVDFGACGACRSSDAEGHVDVERREFLARSAMLMLGSFLAASCGDGQIGGVVGPILLPGGGGGGGGGGSLVIALANFPALAAVGGIARVDNNTPTPVAVARTGPATFVAVSMICPHAAFRPIQITAPGFKCPNHGAEFAPSGDWVGGQPTSDLFRFTTSYDATTQTLTIT